MVSAIRRFDFGVFVEGFAAAAAGRDAGSDSYCFIKIVAYYMYSEAVQAVIRMNSNEPALTQELEGEGNRAVVFVFVISLIENVFVWQLVGLLVVV